MISYDDIKSGRAVAPVAPDANSIPSLIVRAAQRLSEAKSSAEVLEAKAAAELALHYAKVTKAANESHADCLRIITRAEIRMAGEIDRGQETGHVARRGGDRKSNVPAADNGVTMAELGVSRQRVNEWRKVAEAGEEKVDEAISEALADGRAPTKADVLKAAGVVKDKPKADEDQQFADLMRAWNAAGQGARSRFLARNNLTPTKKGGYDAKSAQVPAEHCDLIYRRRQDDTHEQDRSESRQVRSGRNIAGVAAPRVGTSIIETPAESAEISASNFPSDDDAFSEVKGTARPENAAGVEPSSSDNPSTAPTVEPEATPSPPPASGTPIPDPHSPRLTTGGLHPSSDDAGAKSGVPHAVGQGCASQAFANGQSEQQPAVEPQGRNEPVSGETASVTKFAVMSKADQIRLIRPYCQHLDDLDKCGGSGRNHCPACKKAMAESEAAA